MSAEALMEHPCLFGEKNITQELQDLILSGEMRKNITDRKNSRDNYKVGIENKHFNESNNSNNNLQIENGSKDMTRQEYYEKLQVCATTRMWMIDSGVYRDLQEVQDPPAGQDPHEVVPLEGPQGLANAGRAVERIEPTPDASQKPEDNLKHKRPDKKQDKRSKNKTKKDRNEEKKLLKEEQEYLEKEQLQKAEQEKEQRAVLDKLQLNSGQEEGEQKEGENKDQQKIDHENKLIQKDSAKDQEESVKIDYNSEEGWKYFEENILNK
eukprot:CAMPEP_0116993832 /NCGR_PEP_ID=MMETSP0467-20121206/67725_1 /TAXON_ID=283647 /ORGANISM="Mesodinium pulex, Strain SPMC105" /LENGTH=266 /DNA_ID=CAMNT_0004691695 /DNA_START=732 /DNA_END=1535 /DNA_ORIENTATION=+